MPLKRKLIKVGNSRAIVIPTDWLKAVEDCVGPIEYVLMDIGDKISIAFLAPGEERVMPASQAEENNTQEVKQA
ncbi:MAG: hypothetical protein PHX05_09445 [Acidobacteriota bacterium]|nr:hypothetical protein [Acidobacteriota bacterium]